MLKIQTERIEWKNLNNLKIILEENKKPEGEQQMREPSPTSLTDATYVQNVNINMKKYVYIHLNERYELVYNLAMEAKFTSNGKEVSSEPTWRSQYWTKMVSFRGASQHPSRFQTSWRIFNALFGPQSE